MLADYKSRQFHDSAEWSLHPKMFDYIAKKLGIPNVDLFASHENYQIKPYVSWMPDPAASAIDAFSIDWELMFPLIFLPFSILNKVIKKGIAGIDTGRFTAHSCRSASTSAAEFSGIWIDTIRKAAECMVAHDIHRHF